MRLAKMRLRDKFQELETVESSEIDKKPPAGGRLHAEIDRLKDAKEFYRKTMLETRNIILHSRNIVRINRVKQKGIKKSFDTAYLIIPALQSQ